MTFLRPGARIFQIRRGFTLVELLVAVTIVMLMAALMVPTWKNLVAHSQNARCISNLKQVGTGVLAYAADNGGWVMPWAYANDKAPASGSKYWHVRLWEGGYVDSRNAFFCPSQPPRNLGELESLGVKFDEVARIYGMREWRLPGPAGIAVTGQDPKPLSVIERPSEFFLLADSVRPEDELQGYVIRYDARGQWRVHLRHQGKENAFFVSGHVAPMARDYFENIGVTQSEYSHVNGLRVWPE